MRTIALETFKIIHKKSPLFLQDLVTIKNNIYNFITYCKPLYIHVYIISYFCLVICFFVFLFTVLLNCPCI